MIDNTIVKVLIIEDELHNSRMLNGMVNDLRPNWLVEAIIDSVEEAIEYLNTNPHPDLLLVDIQLVDGISFSIFDKVKLQDHSHIIFTTAYDEYAVRAFKVNSVDYLLKPIKEEDLTFAFEKYEQNYLSQGNKSSLQDNILDYQKIFDAAIKGQHEYRSRFLVASGAGFIKVNTSDIAFIYSANKNTLIMLFSGKEYLLDYTLEQLEIELDPKMFYRTNRQCILNAESVAKISLELGNKLKVQTIPQAPFEIIVSRLKATDFKQWLGK